MSLVVFEGLDCSGKTTLINNLLPKFKSPLHIATFKSCSFLDKITHRFPSALTFSLALLYVSYRIVMPNKKDKLVLQERYMPTIETFSPSKKSLSFILRIYRLFVPKPDIFVYVTVGLKERMERLAKTKYNSYHSYLFAHPELIKQREMLYRRIYANFEGKKILIDTSFKTAKANAHKLFIFLVKVLPNKFILRRTIE